MSDQVKFVAPFIVIEGDEGTGKSTVAKAVVAKLEAAGIPYVHTFEPGGTALGTVLRKELIMKREVPLDPVTHILLHQAYRCEHIREVILPALLAGTVVVCERFYYSTLALNIMPYLNERPELQQLFMDTMPHIASRIPEPVTFILDIADEAVRQERLAGRDLDGYESRSPEELAATTLAYKQFQGDPSILTLDATFPPETLADRIVEQIQAQIAKSQKDSSEFDEQLAATTTDGAADVTAAAEPEPEAPFDLEQEVESFLDENFVAALFNHDESQLAAQRGTARAYILTLFNAAKDPIIFKGVNRNRMRTQLHSIFHFGYQLDMIRQGMVTPEPANA